MIKYSIARPEDINELSKLFFKIFKQEYKEYLNYNLKEETCRAVSELYIKAGKTIIAKDKNKIIGFVSTAVPLFSLWKQGLSNFLPGRFMFIAPVKLKYLFKPFCLMIGVDSDYRRRGIGIKLSRELERLVREEGAHEVYTQIFCRNEPIKSLFMKSRWSLVKKCKCGCREILILRKEL